MRNGAAERRTAMQAAGVFVVLVLACLLLLRILDGPRFGSVTSALSGVAGVVGALVAIVLAVVALKVARTAEISQSPEYQSAFRAYRAVWELDGLTDTVLGSTEARVNPELSRRVIDVACGADFMMFLSATAETDQTRGIEAQRLRRDLMGSDEDFKRAVEKLRTQAIESLRRLEAAEATPGPHSFPGFVQQVVRAIGMPPDPVGNKTKEL